MYRDNSRKNGKETLKKKTKVFLMFVCLFVFTNNFGSKRTFCLPPQEV